MSQSMQERFSGDDLLASRQVRAWYLLVFSLALHVIDEASTGFLAFYNPLVERLRQTWSWFPMPSFTFSVWLTGLIVLVAFLAALGPLVRRGGRGTRAISWILSAIMLLNGAGHLLGSLYFRRWLPGATTAPLVLLTASLLAANTYRRQRS